MVDLALFGAAAAARNGLTAMPVNTNEDFFKINATNYLVMPEDRYLKAIMASSANAANITQWTAKELSEANTMDFGTGNMRTQTGAFTQEMPMRLNKKFPANSQMYCTLGNGNNSQVDLIAAFLARNAKDQIQFGSQGMIELPEGYEWYRFTGAATLGAGLLTDVALTPVTFYPDDGAKYHIAGVSGWSATGHFGRLKHKSKGTQGIRPGFIMGDDAAPAVMTVTMQDFGSFIGSEYPIAQIAAGAGDTAEELLLCIKRVA